MEPLKLIGHNGEIADELPTLRAGILKRDEIIKHLEHDVIRHLKDENQKLRDTILKLKDGYAKSDRTTPPSGECAREGDVGGA